MVKTILGTSKVGGNNRIPITPVMSDLKLRFGDFVMFVKDENGHVFIEKVEA